MVEPPRMLENLPSGFRFRPTDEEHIAHYLKRKLKADDPSFHRPIPEIHVCNYEPWDLPAFSAIKSDDAECFFFSPHNHKYCNNARSNRTTSSCCFWKATGKERKITARGTNNVIGTNNTLVLIKS